MNKIITVILLTFSPLLIYSQLIVNEGFESENYIVNTFRNHKGNRYLTTDAREGSRSLRFDASSGAERSEITIREGNPSKYFVWGTEYWHGWSMKINSPPLGFRIIKQYHAIPNGNPSVYTHSAGTNSFSIQVSATQMNIRTATIPGNVNVNPSTGGAVGLQASKWVNYTQGEWIDIVNHFVIATDNTGYWETWVNGEKVIDIQNSPTSTLYDAGGFTKFPQDYAKIGLYYGTGNASGDIQYDSYRIWRGSGGTYEKVSPLGLSPVGGSNPPPDPPTPVNPNQEKKRISALGISF